MSSSKRAALIEEARSWLGTPYHYRAAVKGAGCDCVGLINALRAWVTGEPLLPMPAYSPDFAAAADHEPLRAAADLHLEPVALGREQPGDVLAFRWLRSAAVKHAGVLVAPDRMIHADMRAGVVEVSVESWRRHGCVAAAYGFPGVI